LFEETPFDSVVTEGRKSPSKGNDPLRREPGGPARWKEKRITSSAKIFARRVKIQKRLLRLSAGGKERSWTTAAKKKGCAAVRSKKGEEIIKTNQGDFAFRNKNKSLEWQNWVGKRRKRASRPCLFVESCARKIASACACNPYSCMGGKKQRRAARGQSSR